ncbi:MAG: DUF1501 domain-containing protein [Gemmataceae bacterium]|nr:DUF1501 domain-containing protein [Gemmataceae bacterium]
MAGRIPPGPVPGGRGRHPARRGREADRVREEPHGVGRRAAAAARPAGRGQPPARRRPGRPQARSPDRVVRAGLPDADRGRRDVRPGEGAAAGPGPVRRTPAGRQCFRARRLVEKGVRFVQVFNSGWDHHGDLAEGLRNQEKDLDKGVAALLTDLRQRGLLDDTLVVCCGEFGRTPTADGDRSGVGKGTGRVHNHRGFTARLAGGGVKGGPAVGATDELGFAAVENPVHVHDLHATIPHLLGLDHEKLTYRHAGRDFRLTDVSGRVVRDVLG